MWRCIIEDGERIMDVDHVDARGGVHGCGAARRRVGGGRQEAVSAAASIAAAWREVGDAAEAGKAEAAQTSLTTCNVPSGDRGLD